MCPVLIGVGRRFWVDRRVESGDFLKGLTWGIVVGREDFLGVLPGLFSSNNPHFFNNNLTPLRASALRSKTRSSG